MKPTEEMFDRAHVGPGKDKSNIRKPDFQYTPIKRTVSTIKVRSGSDCKKVKGLNPGRTKPYC